MRNVAKPLGVEAMSLYNHVANKEDLVDGLIDIVFGEIEFPAPGEADWKVAMRTRAISIREALNRHRWAVGLMEGRMNPGPANIRYHDRVMGCLREGGFAFRDAVHAYSLQDAYIYGFALQEKYLPFETPSSRRRRSTRSASRCRRWTTSRTSWRSRRSSEGRLRLRDEFLFGLDLILDGLERFRAAGSV